MKQYLSIMAALLGLCTTVCADTIIVPNHSFESGTNGWTVTSSGNGPVGLGVFDSTGTFSSTPLPSPADGHNTTRSQLDAAGGGPNPPTFSVFTTETSLGNVVDNIQYILTVAAGNHSGLDGGNFTSPDLYTIEILLDGIAAATTTFDGDNLPSGGIPDGTFLDITASFIAGPLDAGKAITLALTHTVKDASNGVTGYFDNVRLDAISAVPEPSTLALIMTSGVLLLIQRRRLLS